METVIRIMVICAIVLAVAYVVYLSIRSQIRKGRTGGGSRQSNGSNDRRVK